MNRVEMILGVADTHRGGGDSLDVEVSRGKATNGEILWHILRGGSIKTKLERRLVATCIELSDRTETLEAALSRLTKRVDGLDPHC